MSATSRINTWSAADHMTISTNHVSVLASCGLRGCKNRTAPFPGRMS